jgi:hypothetical protein
MSITTYLDPTQLPNRTQDQPTFDANMAAFFSALPTFGQQVNATAANLNSVAAGGAYAIPFRVSTQANIGGPSGGNIACESTAASLAAAASLYVDPYDARSLAVRQILDDMYYSGVNTNPTNKGYVKLTKSGDPTSWITFRISNWNFTGTYGILSVSCTGYSSVNPFVIGDVVVASFQRNGDKGDTGPLNTLPYFIVRDQRANGVAGQLVNSGTWTTRVFNTSIANGISGASLGTAGANIITLPAGTYLIDASAEAVATQAGVFKHQIRLSNLTAGTVHDVGTSEYQNINVTNTHFIGTRSIMRTFLTVTGATNITFDHYSSLSATGGYAVSGSGSVSEVYAEARFIKML